MADEIYGGRVPELQILFGEILSRVGTCVH